MSGLIAALMALYVRWTSRKRMHRSAQPPLANSSLQKPIHRVTAIIFGVLVGVGPLPPSFGMTAVVTGTTSHDAATTHTATDARTQRVGLLGPRGFRVVDDDATGPRTISSAWNRATDAVRSPERVATDSGGKEANPPKKRGNAPTDADGNPIELHHDGQSPDSPLEEMTRDEHRGPGNFSKNHDNTGQEPSRIDRGKFNQERKKYWSDQ